MNRRAERRERLGPALEAVTVNGAPIDDHSFDLTLALYKDSAKMALPVPLLKMIIPSGLAHWNVLKGGSDSITKILDGNEYQVPTSDNQSDAIGRLLMLFAYQLMKLVQLAMNDKDVSNYGSVRNARKCSSARCPYYKALELIIAECKKRVLSGRSTATVPVATTSTIAATFTTTTTIAAAAVTSRTVASTAGCFHFNSHSNHCYLCHHHNIWLVMVRDACLRCKHGRTVTWEEEELSSSMVML